MTPLELGLKGQVARVEERDERPSGQLAACAVRVVVTAGGRGGAPGSSAFGSWDTGCTGERMAAEQAGLWAEPGSQKKQLNPEGDRKSRDLKQRRNKIYFC